MSKYIEAIMPVKSNQRPPMPYKAKYKKCYLCAYCNKSFDTGMKMQKHILNETCLPEDPTIRWIVKFLTLEMRSDQAEAKAYLDKEFDLDLEEECGKTIEDRFEQQMIELLWCDETLE